MVTVQIVAPASVGVLHQFKDADLLGADQLLSEYEMSRASATNLTCFFGNLLVNLQNAWNQASL